MSELILRQLTEQECIPTVEEQKAVAAIRFHTGRPRRPVLVLALEEMSPFAFKPGDIFPGLMPASKRLGLLSTTQLHASLKKANGAPAKIRGVTFQYLADYQKGQSK